jgi:hypothetical protein
MRKWWDMRQSSGWEKSGNLVNAGKYFSCILLVVFDVLQKLHPRPFVFPLVPIQGLWLGAAILKTVLVHFVCHAPQFEFSRISFFGSNRACQDFCHHFTRSCIHVECNAGIVRGGITGLTGGFCSQALGY